MTIRLYIDANIFIHAYEKNDGVSQIARTVMEMIDGGRALCVISEMLVAELLVTPFRENDLALVETYKELLSSPYGYEAHRVDHDVLFEAARLRADNAGLKLPDAILIATARLTRCCAFVTGDRRLAPPAGMLAVPLDASTLDSIRALA